MTLLTAIGIGLLGGLGAVARLLADAAVSERLTTSFPVGTFAVNMAGTLALGVLAGVTTDEQTLRLLATGLLGSFTTFSTWMLETQRLAEDGNLLPAAVNLAASLAAGLALAWIGTEIGGVL